MKSEPDQSSLEIIWKHLDNTWIRTAAVHNVDLQQIDALDQWCLRRILGIHWHES